jgi:transposase
MAREELEALTKGDLIDLILKQAEQLAKLQADYEALKLKFEKNQKPPPSSQNSSQPPSRDQKRSLPSDRRKRKHGPPAGHPKHERKFVARPDHMVDVRTDTCPACQTDLSAEAGWLIDVHQITELPPAKAEVIEVRQYALIYPQCGEQHVSPLPEGLA